jgi:hypothetical protein
MRNFIATIILLHLPLVVYSQDSPLEGIYSVLVPNESAYATVQVKGNEVIIMLLYNDGWEPYVGTVDGNVITAAGVTAIVGVDVKISASLSTPSILSKTLDSCSGVTEGNDCLFPPGYVLQAFKVW